MSDVGTFADVRDDLMFGPLSVDAEAEDNQPAPTSEAPDKESPLQTEDKLASDPAATEETEETQPEEKAEDTPAEASKSEGEQAAGQSPADDDPEIEIGEGEKVRLSVLKDGYRQRQQIQKDLQANATRKFQEAARMREDADRLVNEHKQLVADIARDPDMQEFIRAHPEALSYLLDQPEATRKLLGNAKAINEFWEDYETLQKNPRLAERLSQGDPKAQEALQAQQTRERIQWIADSLDAAVAQIAEQYPGVDVSKVEDYLLELAGISRDERDAEKTANGFARLYNLFFVQTKEGVRIDGKLIRDRFEYLAADARRAKEREEADAKKHNAEVDAELAREKNAPPATPAGSAPIAEREKERTFNSFEEAFQDLLYGSGK